MLFRPSWFYRQSGVIPYRLTDNNLEVLLVTTRGNKRWVIPKGVIELRMTAADSASKEAYEEAGVSGDLSPAPVGVYTYDKWGGVCTVTVFTLRVDNVLKSWPEETTRKRKWMSLRDAAESVKSPQLRDLILALPTRIAGSVKDKDVR